MGIPVLILGESGSGKSTALRNFEPGEIGVFNVASKPLPFRKKLPMVNGATYQTIIKGLSAPKLKTYAIDDSQYLLAFEFFDRAKETGYNKFTDIALNFRNLIQFVITSTPPDCIVYFLHHVETNADGTVTWTFRLRSAKWSDGKKVTADDFVYAWQRVLDPNTASMYSWFVEMFLKKSIPTLYEALGVYLPLITTNCAVLGVVLLNVQEGYNFIESVVYGITGGAGFLLAIVLFASIRERLQFSEPPKAFRGFPIALITAGLMALSFMGFSGLQVW